MIPYGHQLIEADDIDAVVRVLKGDWLTQGPAVEEFEAAIVEATGARHAVAFSSGTAALHGAVAVSGLGPDDTVVTSPLSFVASANCARYVGAATAFVDIDPTTLNLDVTQVPATAAGLVAVHFAGLPVDLSQLTSRPRVVIEDAAHALGAETPDGPVGNCARSDMTVFSFHPVKIVTTGEGGAVTTNDQRLSERLRRFRNHCIDRQPEHGGWYYEVRELGYNYRLTDIQAALGVSQMCKLRRFVHIRQQLASEYRHRLRELPLQLPPEAPAGFTHAYHLFPVRVADRRRVYERLRAAGIGVQVHYVPLSHHPLYRSIVGEPADLPNVAAAYQSLLSLPLYPGMSGSDFDRVVNQLSSILRDA